MPTQNPIHSGVEMQTHNKRMLDQKLIALGVAMQKMGITSIDFGYSMGIDLFSTQHAGNSVNCDRKTLLNLIKLVMEDPGYRFDNFKAGFSIDEGGWLAARYDWNHYPDTEDEPVQIDAVDVSIELPGPEISVSPSEHILQGRSITIDEMPQGAFITVGDQTILIDSTEDASMLIKSLERMIEAQPERAQSACRRINLSEMDADHKALPGTIAYLAAGFRSAQLEYTQENGPLDFDALGEGEREALFTLCQQATLIDQLFKPVLDSGQFNGLFEYGVAEPLGEWYFHELKRNITAEINQHPSTLQVLDQAWGLITDWVDPDIRDKMVEQQDASTHQIPVYAVSCDTSFEP